MTVSVVGTPSVINLSNVNTATPSIASTPAAGDLIIVIVDVASAGGSETSSGTVTGLGATWTEVYYTRDVGGAAQNLAANAVWFGTGATASGNITVTLPGTRYGSVRAFNVRGLTANTVSASTVTYSSSATPSLPGNASTTNATGPSQTADTGQFVLNFWMTTNTASTVVYPATSAPTTGWNTQAVYRNIVGGNFNSSYRIPAASASHQLTATTAAAAGHFITQVVIGDAASSATTAAVAATLPSLTASTAATSTVTAAGAATLPSLSGAVAASVTVAATVAVALPSLTGAVAATSTVTAAAGVSLPSLTASVLVTADNTTSAAVGATLPSLAAAGVVVVTYPAAVDALLPSLTAAMVASVTGDGSSSAVIGATLPSLTVEAGGSGGERVVHCRVDTPDGIVVSVPLVPVTPLTDAVPVMRKSILAPNLTAAYTAHPAPGETSAPVVVEEVVGYPQLWIGGQNVTNLRGVPTIVRRWESEAPFGDTAAAFEFPQLNPWDQPGTGDLAFLRGDASVAIGMREVIVGDGYTRTSVRRLWSGFLDARGNGLGEGEDYAWEAKGTMWQAQSQIREPRALVTPVDIGVQIAKVLNDVDGRRWAKMPLTPIGITTLTRGSRDETVWDYVQALLSEAITDDLRQWSLVEVRPGMPRLVLKPAPTTVHATVAYGTPGVDIDLRVDESTRVDRVFMRGIGPKMGGWANVFYPGIELLAPPPYPNTDLRNIVAGDTDADTDSGTGVTDWQRRVDDLRGFANPAVSGVMSSAWGAVIDDVQRYVGVTADGSLGPQTWNATFDRALRGIDLTPVRLPLASKPEANRFLYTASGVKIGENPEWDRTIVTRDIAVDIGPGKTKAQGRKLARNLLGIYGQAAANGQIVWTTDPRETDRTRISHLSNVKVTGFEGADRVVQVSSKSVELDTGGDGPAYVLTTGVDERARDAMVVEDLLAQRRSAQPDPSRRPGNPSKASRQVSDQRTPWDSESPCGVLRRTAVNGSSGLWTIVTVPFAEVGQLSGIRLHSTRPFALALFASLRITENKLRSVVGNPFTSDSPWRDSKGILDSYGIIEAWGEKGNACGYSPKAETDAGATFTGEFVLDTPVDYWTETVPYVSVAIFMRGGSGWISGQFIPAYES